MTSKRKTSSVTSLFTRQACCLLLACTPPLTPWLAVHASDTVISTPAPLEVEHAFALPTPPGAMTGALYLTLMPSKGTATLIGASTPWAQVIEMHDMQLTNDRMQMKKLDSLPAQADMPLKMIPGGGPHLMLIGLSQPLTAGSKIPLTLQFLARSDIHIEVPVKDYDAVMASTAAQ